MRVGIVKEWGQGHRLGWLGGQLRAVWKPVVTSIKAESVKWNGRQGVLRWGNVRMVEKSI